MFRGWQATTLRAEINFFCAMMAARYWIVSPTGIPAPLHNIVRGFFHLLPAFWPGVPIMIPIWMITYGFTMSLLYRYGILERRKP